MSRFLNGRLSALEEYTPGEQPQDKKYIKLNTNESPYPVPQNVIDAIDADKIKDLRLYNDPECTVLRRKTAELYGVKPKNVFLSNGSDDILNFAFMAYGEKGAAFPDITYGFYTVFADLYGVKADIIPLNEDFTVNVSDYFGKSGLVVLANPNAPTGIALPADEIERIIKANPDSVVLIDEAYVDFGAESCVAFTEKYDNLLVVGTFSKSRSMAGARLGFAIANETLISDLEKIKYSTNPYNINRITQIAGAAALDNNGYFMSNCKKIAETRGYTAEKLKAMGFVVTDSKANFLFASHPQISGKDFYLKLKERGILIRHFEKPRIKDYNRITVGSREEMEAFLTAAYDILGGLK